MTDRARLALRAATNAALDAGRQRVDRWHMTAAVVASGGVATNVAVNLGADVSALPRVNAVRTGNDPTRLPFDPVLLRVVVRARLLAEAWVARRLLTPGLGYVSTYNLLIALLEECPNVCEILRTTPAAALAEGCRLLGWDEQVALVRVTDREVDVTLEEARRESASPRQ